jgi:serine protease AprX
MFSLSFISGAYADSLVLKEGSVKQGNDRLGSMPVLHVTGKRTVNSANESLEDHVLRSLGGTKLFGNAKTWYDTSLSDSSLEAIVSLNYSIADVGNVFENKLKKTFGEQLTYTKLIHDKYQITLSKKQIDILQTFHEVLYIATTHEGEAKGAGTRVSDSSSVMTPSSVFSVDYTGAVKARTDFGVTGDLDGHETTYSMSDVVIAVLDTGIDGNHSHLNNNKVIGWHDVIGTSTTAYDDNGHGTAVASVAAGTGSEGYAPGAALVGVKVLDQFNHGSDSNVYDGLVWVYNNRSTYSIDAVNLSIESTSSSGATNVKNEIALLNSVGIPVFVCAGNYGDGLTTVDGNTFYDTVNRYAVGSPYIIGNVADPGSAGWGLAKDSSKGTDASGIVERAPTITAPGYHVSGAIANTTSSTGLFDGTSFATPAMAGIYALMKDAAITSGSNQYSFFFKDRGPTGFDKLFGNGIIAAYESVKYSYNASTGSYSDGLDYLYADDSETSGNIAIYQIQVDSSTQPFNTTLYTLDEGSEEMDLYIWGPGHSPFNGDPPDYSDPSSTIKEGTIGITSPTPGNYWIGVNAVDDANFHLDFNGDIHA